MSSAFEDSVVDFDLSPFQQSFNNAVGQNHKDKVRKAILLSKRKMLSTDSLIRKYYDKRLGYRALERCLVSSKEEYKQACIESMEYREKCLALEDEIKKLRLTINESELKCVAAYNQHDGMQSHAKQLQQLVKENETLIESLKIEHQLEKANFKEVEKSYAILQKENELLTKNICCMRDIVLGKKKLTKEIRLFLLKYNSNTAEDAEDAEEICCNDADTFDDPSSPSQIHHSSPDSELCNDELILSLPMRNKEDNKNAPQSELRSIDINEGNIHTRDDNDHDSECSNEVVSLDTGRGSSLAFSDSDKCFNSPEYFNHHSPLNAEVLRSKDKLTVNVSTSPLPMREVINVSTSPVIFENLDILDGIEKIVSNVIMPKGCDNNGTENSATTPIMIDRLLSPIFATHCVEISTSPVKNPTKDAATSPLKQDIKTSNCNNQHGDQNTQEKDYLEINNSSCIDDENSNDCEVQMIFDSMRFSQKLITPIPTTPAKSRNVEASTNAVTQTIHAIACPDAAKLREENVALQATVAKLANEIQNIQEFISKLSPLINNDKCIGTSRTPQILSGDRTMSLFDRPDEDIVLEHNNNAPVKISGAIDDNSIHFDDKLTKLKNLNNILFADSSPPSPSDAAPCALTPSPPRAPQGRHADRSDTGHGGQDVSLKVKERLRFEDPISNRGPVADGASSDCEVYEREIVIELAPDSLESDTNCLHEMLKEQVSKQQKIPEEAQKKRIPRMKKKTKLEKLRKKMLPKSKIKRVDVQGKIKKRLQPKRLTTSGDRILDSLISNKAAYEKACKVMSELRSNEKVRKNDDNAIVVLPELQLSPEKGAQKTYKKSELIMSTEKPCMPHQNEGIDQNDLSMVTSIVMPMRSTKPTEAKYEISDAAKICKKNVYSKNKTTPEIVPTSENSRALENNSALPGQRILRTRSQSKSMNQNDSCQPLVSPKMYVRNRRKSKVEESIIHNNDTIVSGLNKSNIATATEESDGNTDNMRLAGKKTLKRQSVDKPDVAPKRMLRSSAVLNDLIDPRSKSTLEKKEEMFSKSTKDIVSYGDMDIFEDTEKHTNELVVPSAKNYTPRRAEHPKFGILCNLLDRYARKSPKISASKLPENAINIAYKKIEDGIAEMQKLPHKDCKVAMDSLVQNLQGLKQKQILGGIIKFLKEPTRKIELFNKLNVPPAPPMTKAEQILIYIVSQLKVNWPDIVENILRNIEYSLFMLNRTPEFDVIETLAHFYAVLCRYDKSRNRLRLFIIDAMYCLQYKAVPLIKQCLEVWMHILPLAHMGIAKNPLVTCLVYLLHFYKCEDKFNRVQEIRNILNRKYFYEVSEWNEPRILEMFKNSIIELSDVEVERKMLRIALVILAKRHGARWCQKNIIKNMLVPIIEQPQVPDRIKQFCVSLLGPLLKPYPMDMKVNCEIVMNQLFDMLSHNSSEQMEEAIFTSLIYMSRHNQNRVIKALLFWKPDRISPELEDLLKNYVKERPMKSWRTVLSKISIQQT